MSDLEGESFDDVPLAHKLCKPLAWEAGFAECWGRAKRLRGSTMQKKGLLRRHIWRTSRDLSRFQGFFNVSPSQSQKMPWSQDKNKNKIWKKTNLHLLQGSCIYSFCGRHAHLSAHIFWGIYSDFALHHTHLERSSLIWTCHECCNCGSLRFSKRTETSPFTTVSTGIARKEVWCLVHSHSPSCPSPFKHQGGKKGGENYQVFLTSTEKSHSKSPLVSLGCLLEYITPLHTGTYTHVHSFTESIRKKYFKDHNFL